MGHTLKQRPQYGIIPELFQSLDKRAAGGAGRLRRPSAPAWALAFVAAACGGAPTAEGDLDAGGDTPGETEGAETGKGAKGGGPPSNWWQPGPGLTWQWHIQDVADTSYGADVYDIDLFDNDASVVADLHALGRKVICYVSVGSWEEWRPDKDRFPAEVIGNSYDGWAGEKWLDIRQIDKLGPILGARMDLCREKGFDALEPDNIDGYTNDTGFPLTAEDQLAFNRWLASAAHARGLGIGLKNDPDQAAELVSDFDWALTEDCFDQGWCGQMSVFVARGKPVFQCEYTDTGVTTGDFCPESAELGFSGILKNRDLDAWIRACEP